MDFDRIRTHIWMGGFEKPAASYRWLYLGLQRSERQNSTIIVLSMKYCVTEVNMSQIRMRFQNRILTLIWPETHVSSGVWSKFLRDIEITRKARGGKKESAC